MTICGRSLLKLVEKPVRDEKHASSSLSGLLEMRRLTTRADALIGVLLHGCPVAIAIAFWGVAGLGMGVCFNTDTVLAIQSTSEYSAGMVSSSMQLSDSLGQTLGTGFGGGAMALASWMGWGRSHGIGITFAISAAICLVAIVTSPRLSAAQLQP